MIKRFDEWLWGWTKRHPHALRVLVVGALLFSISTPFRTGQWGWLTSGLTLLNVLALIALTKMWRRRDALDELEGHVAWALDDPDLGKVAWLLGYSGVSTREVRELNYWLRDHDLLRTPVDDLPPKVRDLRVVLASFL